MAAVKRKLSDDWITVQGAHSFTPKENSVMFVLGDTLQYIGNTVHRVRNGALQVPRWIATKNVEKWNLKWVDANTVSAQNDTETAPQQPLTDDERTRIIALLQQVMEIVWKKPLNTC